MNNVYFFVLLVSKKNNNKKASHFASSSGLLTAMDFVKSTDQTSAFLYLCPWTIRSTDVFLANVF